MMDEVTKHGIKNSTIFMIVGSQNYFNDIPQEQVDYAKSLKKPFRVFVDKGVTVPEGFSEGVEDYKEKAVDIDKIKELDINKVKEFLGV